MNRQDILTLYDYNVWANGRMLGVVEPLSPEAFLKELKSSFPSVRDTVAHILGAEWIWLRRWQGEAPTKLPSASDFPTPQILKERFAAVEKERRAFLEALSEGQLVQSLNYRDTAGNPHSLPLVHSLQHVVNHGSYHRGQVTMMLRQLGATPISLDMSRFYLERAREK